MDHSKPPEHIHIDERNHVKMPLLEQLTGWQWEVLERLRRHVIQRW